MDSQGLGFWARVWLAIVLPWLVLFNSTRAARFRRLLDAERTPEALPAAGEAALAGAAGAEEADPTAALQLLAILQREGRLIDFLQEEVAGYSDAEIGAAARVVHEGCRRGLGEYLVLEPVRPESEGDTVVVEAGFDAARTRVTGNVVGEPPFRGRLAHHGWLVKEVRLPRLSAGHDPRVVTPAEVEL